MSFKIKDESVCIKYSQIWNKIKELLLNYYVNFYSDPIYDEKYNKVKVKTFSEAINALFTVNNIPKEKIEYICIPVISVDSVLKVNKKNYPQVYLEQCKYKIKKRELKSFIDYEIILSSDDDSN